MHTHRHTNTHRFKKKHSLIYTYIFILISRTNIFICHFYHSVLISIFRSFIFHLVYWNLIPITKQWNCHQMKVWILWIKDSVLFIYLQFFGLTKVAQFFLFCNVIVFQWLTFACTHHGKWYGAIGAMLFLTSNSLPVKLGETACFQRIVL